MRFLLGVTTLIAVPVVAVVVAMRLLGGGGEAAPLSGAIFTTTPNGGIVNENVRYERKIEVYLDGGPGPNAPQTAAGLPDGDYVFQVTDPPGKVLLSEDAARCRVFRVSDGVIVALRDKANGGFVDHTATDECHVNDGPESAAGTSGKHDTNTDSDHGPPAIVVQLMPFFDTPNPGGVYKAWVVPVGRYLANGGNLNAAPTPQCVRNGKPANNCNGSATKIGYVRDPGFGPPRDQVKTDNFKVKEFFPPEITVRKFHDLDGDGIWDLGEPEIGVDQFVLPDGSIDGPLGGGWPYDFTEPVDGGTVTNRFYTPQTHVAGIAGVYTACELRLSGWTQTAALLDGVLHNADQCVSVNVAGTSGEKHEIIFGNFRNVDVEACKYEDKTGDGLTPDDTPIAGWTVHLTKNGVVQDTQQTRANGCYKWENLGPVLGGYYDVSEDVPDGWTPTSPTSHNFESPPQSGASYTFTFTNFENVDVEACKFNDITGDGLTADDTPIADWTVHLTKNGVVQDTQVTGADGCYKWTDLGPVPDGYYDVSEDVPAGWTPTSNASHNFESPPRSGASYTFTFTNFKNVKVTACKLRDSDGDLATTGDQSPIAGWTVHLTKNGVVQDTRQTGADGCYTWENLGPLPADSYYDVSEDVPPGWIPLTPTSYNFESPPRSGASYSFTFINTPSEGCTPGYWKNHPEAWGQTGFSTEQTVESVFGRASSDPYVSLGGATLMDALSFQGGDTIPEAAEILLRAAVAAVLNAAHPAVAYPRTASEIASDVNAALDSQDRDTILGLASGLDGDNNGPGGCPLN